MGGAIVDSGNFDWEKSGKFSELTTPDDSYHGLIYTEAFGKAAYITKARTQLIRDLGACPSPFNSYLTISGLETLSLRMQRHCDSALKIAKWLEAHPCISWVNYPALESSKYYELAKKYLPKGSCGVVSFGVKGGRANAELFMNSLNLASIATHVADAKTCCLHPASATHRQMNDEELLAAGVSPDLIRYSCGIESAEDLIADLKQALESV